MPPTDTSLQWIRPARQARTQQTLERLLDASELLLQDKGFDDIHVSEIALRANTSVASFYRRFKDKNALLYSLHERFTLAAMATADDALDPNRWADSSIREILESFLPFLIEVLQSQSELQRAVYRIALSDESIRELSNRLRHDVLSGVSRLLLARRSEIRHPEPESAVPFALVQAAALLTEWYLTGMKDTSILHLTDRQIANQIVQSCCSYLVTCNAETQEA
ncbi:MAG: TetR/AcrR family transcriptional regulator [Myxococcota bacterium]|nr:TetR/AcrR family transcriptional regulator [Myxococcota bacterium]